MHEVQRYEKVLAEHDKAALKSSTSLSLLNVGQNFIFSTSITAMMYMASLGVVQGTMVELLRDCIGDSVAIL
jgi:ABC transporter ATM